MTPNGDGFIFHEWGELFVLLIRLWMNIVIGNKELKIIIR